VEGVDIRPAGRRQIDAQQFRRRPRVQSEHVVMRPGAAQANRAAPLGDDGEVPDAAKEARGRRDVTDAEVGAD